MENPTQFFQQSIGAAMFRPSLFVCNFYIFFIVLPKDIRISKQSARGKLKGRHQFCILETNKLRKAISHTFTTLYLLYLFIEKEN